MIAPIAKKWTLPADVGIYMNENVECTNFGHLRDFIGRQQMYSTLLFGSKIPFPWPAPMQFKLYTMYLLAFSWSLTVMCPSFHHFVACRPKFGSWIPAYQTKLAKFMKTQRTFYTIPMYDETYTDDCSSNKIEQIQVIR